MAVACGRSATPTSTVVGGGVARRTPPRAHSRTHKHTLLVVCRLTLRAFDHLQKVVVGSQRAFVHKRDRFRSKCPRPVKRLSCGFHLDHTNLVCLILRCRGSTMFSVAVFMLKTVVRVGGSGGATSSAVCPHLWQRPRRRRALMAACRRELLGNVSRQADAHIGHHAARAPRGASRGYRNRGQTNGLTPT